MLGFSVYLNQDLDHQTKSDIKLLAKKGFQGIFTSLHIPEEDVTQYRKRLLELARFAQTCQLNLMIDISKDALEQAGFSLENLEELKNAGVTGLRIDDQIANETIAKWSHQIHIALNASTITSQDVQELNAYQADFTRMEAWHNYYPRPETGLERTWYQQKNEWLHQQGFQTQAFIPGDANLRGPLKQGLPTLEEHRHLHPLATFLDLTTLATDHVYLGDAGIQSTTLAQFLQWQDAHVLSLQVEVVDRTHQQLFLGQHTSRLDTSRDVVRSADARFKSFMPIAPAHTTTRTKGSVTLDNQDYLRYMGELQITRTDLPADDKVNVVARVCRKDQDLVPFIKDGIVFELKEGTVQDDKPN